MHTCMFVFILNPPNYQRIVWQESNWWIISNLLLMARPENWNDPYQKSSTRNSTIKMLHFIIWFVIISEGEGIFIHLCIISSAWKKKIILSILYFNIYLPSHIDILSVSSLLKYFSLSINLKFPITSRRSS